MSEPTLLHHLHPGQRATITRINGIDRASQEIHRNGNRQR